MRAKSRNIYEATWEGLGDSLDRIKGWDSITKMSRLVLVTMSMVVSPGKIRNKESRTGVWGRRAHNFQCDKPVGCSGEDGTWGKGQGI